MENATLAPKLPPEIPESPKLRVSESSICCARIPLSLSNPCGLWLGKKGGTCPPRTFVFEHFMGSTFEEYLMLMTHMVPGDTS